MRLVLAGVCAFLLGTVTAPGAAGEDGVAAFTPAGGSLVHSTDDWQVWVVRDEPGNPLRRAVPYRTRYFRQRHGADRAELAFEMRGTYSRKVATVLEDGTLLLHYSTELTWARPGRESTAERLRIGDDGAHVVRGDPDGLLIQPYLLNEEAPVYFVPISGHALRWSARVRLTKEAVSVNSPPRFVRGGDVIAWPGNAYDLRTRTRLPLPPDAEPTACDGKTLALRAYDAPDDVVRVVRLGSGEEPLTIRLDRNAGDHPVFAVRHRIGYLVSYGRADGSATLHALDLGSSERRTKALLVLKGPHRPPPLRDNQPPVPYFTTDAALVVWTGNDWKTLPWLEVWPE